MRLRNNSIFWHRDVSGKWSADSNHWCEESQEEELWLDFSLLELKLKVIVSTPQRSVGNGGIAPVIFNLGTRWKWVVGFTL
jgi:hypothetical protein